MANTGTTRLYHSSEDRTIVRFDPRPSSRLPATRFLGCSCAEKIIVMESAGDLLARLVSPGIELRVTPSLQPLRDALVTSTMAFSMIRLRKMEHTCAEAR